MGTEAMGGGTAALNMGLFSNFECSYILLCTTWSPESVFVRQAVTISGPFEPCPTVSPLCRSVGKSPVLPVLSRRLVSKSATRDGVWTVPRTFAHVHMFLVANKAPPPPPPPPPQSSHAHVPRESRRAYKDCSLYLFIEEVPLLRSRAALHDG